MGCLAWAFHPELRPDRRVEPADHRVGSYFRAAQVAVPRLTVGRHPASARVTLRYSPQAERNLSCGQTSHGGRSGTSARRDHGPGGRTRAAHHLATPPHPPAAFLLARHVRRHHGPGCRLSGRRLAAGPLGHLRRVDDAPAGFQNSATGLDLGFYATRSYSLKRPPRTGRRLIRSRERSATE